MKKRLRSWAAWGLFSFCFHTGFAQVSYTSASSPFPSLQFAPRMVMFDADRDGDIDVLYQNGNTAGANIALLLNNGNGTYNTIAANASGTFTSGPLNGISFTHVLPGGNPSLYPVDYDNDGDIDLVELTSGATGRVLQNTPSGFVVAATPFPTLPYAARILFFDADNDNDIDALYQNGNVSGTNIGLLINDGSGHFSQIDAPGGTFSSGPLNGLSFTHVIQNGNPTLNPVDFDNDGDVDLVETTSNGASRTLYNMGGSFVTGYSPFPTLQYAARIVFMDIDTDGDIDALYQNGNTAGANIALLLNNGNGTYNTIAANASGTFTSGPLNGISFTHVLPGGNPSLYPVDYDNDGDIDLVELTSGAGGRVLRQNGIPPAVAATAPANQATGINPSDNLVLTFNQPVIAGSGTIEIRRSANHSLVETIAAAGARVTGSGTATITIDPENTLPGNTSLYVTFSENAFRNSTGQYLGQIRFEDRILEGISSPNFLTFQTTGVLPLTLLDFTAARTGASVHLQWKTAAETGTSHFVVEHSTDGRLFTAVGTVNTQAGEGTGAAYDFVHRGAGMRIHYYRLKMVDRDGTYTYSTVRHLAGTQASLALMVKNNPFVSTVSLALHADRPTEAMISLFDLSGRKVAGRQVRLHTGENHLSLEGAHLKAGQYLLRVSTPTGEQERMVQKTN